MFFQIRVSRVIFSIHFYHFFILRIIEFFPLFIVFNIIVNLLSLYLGNFTKKNGPQESSIFGTFQQNESYYVLTSGLKACYKE